MDLTLYQPDEMLHPMQEFIRSGTAVEYEEMVAWRTDPQRNVQYALYYVEGNIDEFEATARAIETVQELHVSQTEKCCAIVWVCEEIRPEIKPLFGAVDAIPVIAVPPIRFDSEANLGLTFVGEAEALQSLLEGIPDEIGVTINAVGQYVHSEASVAGQLTNRQREALEVAFEVGYYDIPRASDLSTVANELECVESSASVLLRRAERTIIENALGRDECGSPARAGTQDD